MPQQRIGSTARTLSSTDTDRNPRQTGCPQLVASYDTQEDTLGLFYIPGPTGGINNSDNMTNNVAVNHYSALHSPEVLQFLIKEKSLGAVLKPKHLSLSDHFHCSPILTRPRDVNKRRIILNLSYPYGNNPVKDNVNKEHFDGRKLVLRFPTIDCVHSGSNIATTLMSGYPSSLRSQPSVVSSTAYASQVTSDHQFENMLWNSGIDYHSW